MAQVAECVKSLSTCPGANFFEKEGACSRVESLGGESACFEGDSVISEFVDYLLDQLLRDGGYVVL